MSRTKVAVIGSGNVGTGLMVKVLRQSTTLKMAAMVGIDPDSDGLARAHRLGVSTSARGVSGLIAMPDFDEIDIVFDTTSAGAHRANAAALGPHGKRLIDLTPAAVGPFVVPAVNLDQHLDAVNLNTVTCGGQATIPIVAAISRITEVPYAEIVASIASKSAGRGTRANIDEFTETTARAIEVLGGAARSRAIVILNPAESPLIMRDTVLALINDPESEHDAAVRHSIRSMVAEVAAYVPGYRLKHDIKITPLAPDAALRTLVGDAPVTHQVSVFLEVRGTAHYLTACAGNLDIMTSAALCIAERIAAVSLSFPVPRRAG
ncbi:acetaldehyde dehydrogenase (acetylating) [Nocardia sp. NBC_00565]|uniref:acetaldehyde dehydrogenase (acetylating) n=1 Tax=Nocardia sp. NBC_00565 TaxID=2975993 RepID=UPI002E81284C|nr:acetaldehyde dehydrogenase (acetylating) [Nocardia sp. NBC_00565]WUC07538.1 acetaldehyde dehydrogenase (acetylating) [Nocardia sp. NBC_00565]